MFINYSPTQGISVNTHRNNSTTSGIIEEFITSLVNEEWTNISTDDPKGFLQDCHNALCDGMWLAEAGITDQVAVESAHYIVGLAIDNLEEEELFRKI